LQKCKRNVTCNHARGEDEKEERFKRGHTKALREE
jgi:hypothetical protein